MTKLPAPETETVDLLIIAGEHSGDEHAAKMLRGLKEQMPECRVCAMGGEKLAAEGAQLLLDMTVFSVVGFIEVVKKYRFFKLLLKETCIWIEKYRPKAICFVDYPGFNLRLAKYLFKEKLSRKAGGDIALSYYIGPQIWAWKKGRRFLMSRYLDRLAVIFPFEREAYKDTCLPVDFVGHPLVSPDAVLPVTYREGGPLLLLPGSREQAVARIFPIMVKVFHLLQEREIFDRGVVLYPRGKAVQAVLEKNLSGASTQLKALPVEKANNFPVGAVLTSSGTMSLVCALAGIPGAVVYKANSFTYALGRLLVKIPYLGIANILLQREMYPEYIQGAAKPDKLVKVLQDPSKNVGKFQEAAKELHKILASASSLNASSWLVSLLKNT